MLAHITDLDTASKLLLDEAHKYTFRCVCVCVFFCYEELHVDSNIL